MSAAIPSVSICIPSYNYRRYLRQVLESASNQSYRDIEILVVDDQSTDDSVAFIREYARKDARVVLHENPHRLGLTRNFNQCLRLARGKYIKFLCADDVLETQCVEKMVAAIEGQFDATLIGCRRNIFSDDKRSIGQQGYGGKSRVIDGLRATRRCFFSGNLIGEPTAVLFRKSDAVTGFDENYDQILDLDLWFRLLENGKFCFLAETLCGVREHDSRGSANNLRAGKITSDKVRLFEEYSRRPYLSGSIAERFHWDVRMASSVARESAAGAKSAEAVKAAFYFPRTSTFLIWFASLTTRARSRNG